MRAAPPQAILIQYELERPEGLSAAALPSQLELRCLFGEDRGELGAGPRICKATLDPMAVFVAHVGATHGTRWYLRLKRQAKPHLDGLPTLSRGSGACKTTPGLRRTN